MYRGRTHFGYFSQEKRILLKTGELTQQENQNISAATMKLQTDSFSSEKVLEDCYFSIVMIFIASYHVGLNKNMFVDRSTMSGKTILTRKIKML